MSNKTKQAEGNRVHFRCPGCNLAHGVVIGLNGWTWNNDLARPTFNPSVLLSRTMGNYKFKEDPDYEEHLEICHSFVTDGSIQFLSDSTHALSGSTVELLNWDL